MDLIIKFILFFIFSSIKAQNYDCYSSTTPGPNSAFSCRRDIVIAVDGTPYMMSKNNIYRELDFLETMLSNWTFGDNGANVAFIEYGFNGHLGFTRFFDNFADCKASLEGDRYVANSTTALQYTSLTSVIQFVQTIYGLDSKSGPKAVYPPRPGIEPRLIVFTSTTNQTDIQSSITWFKQLYDSGYDTVLCVAYADLDLYSKIETLKTINMDNFDSQKEKNISSTIETALCVHDDRFTPSPCPLTTTTPSPTGGPVPDGQERSCKCNSKHLWLDVVVVIDNSASMTKDGLDEVAAHVLTVFGGFTTLNQSLDQSIRLAIVSMSDSAKIIADFDSINSPNDASRYLFQIPLESTVSEVNLLDAFQKTASIFNYQGSKRNNTRKVVILYTSTLNLYGSEDPIPIANQLKNSGVHIIGVEFIQTIEAPFFQKLSAITSPNMTFSNIYSHNPLQKTLLNITIDALCWINCFCVNLWEENKNPFTVFPQYAQCFYMSDIDSGWTPAAMSCPDMASGSSMAFIKTKQKFEYLINLLANLPSSDGSSKLHLGIFYNSSLGTYEYLDGGIMTSQDYSPWDKRNGFPDASKGTCVAAYKVYGLTVELKNIDCFDYYARYACELAPCDTENYCHTLDVF